MSTAVTTTTSSSTTLVTGMVHMWNFAADSASQADEITGDGDNFTLTVLGAVHSSDHGGIYKYDGLDDEIKINGTHSGFIDFTSNFTVSVWSFAYVAVRSHTIWAMSDGVDRYLVGRTTNNKDKLYATAWDSGYTSIETDSNVSTGVWHHIVFTHTGTAGGTVGLYVNGTNQTDATTGQSTSNSDGMTVGSRTDENDTFDWDGEIDTLIITTGILSQAEVDVLYLNGAATKN